MDVIDRFLKEQTEPHPVKERKVTALDNIFDFIGKHTMLCGIIFLMALSTIMLQFTDIVFMALLDVFLVINLYLNAFIYLMMLSLSGIEVTFKECLSVSFIMSLGSLMTVFLPFVGFFVSLILFVLIIYFLWIDVLQKLSIKYILLFITLALCISLAERGLFLFAVGSLAQ